jgi:nucleotide-binding universal stress UspA family protein
MFKKILLGVDGSEHALRAAKVTGELSRKLRSDVWVVACFDPVPAYLGEPNLQQAVNLRLQQAEEVLNPALEAIGNIPGALRTEVLEGPPAEAILNVAQARGSDLIIMGTRGRGQLAGLLLGSQSQKVIMHACCPVMLIR